MTNANYIYNIEPFAGVQCIFIQDDYKKGRGLKTVTNDAENVVKEIANKERIDPKTHIIVIKDTEGKWDGYSAGEDKFEILNATNPYHAVNRWLKRVREAAGNGNQ